MSKSWVIFVDGIDRSGKSTLITELNKATNYRHTIIDRGPLSTAVYIDKYNREESSIDCINNLKDLSKSGNILQILCEAQVHEIIKRVKDTDEKDYINVDDENLLKSEILSDLELFKKYYNMILRYELDCVRIDTTYNSIYNNVRSVCNTLDILGRIK